MKNRLPTITYELNLTNKCNLACKYCFEKDKGNCSIEVEDIKDIIQNPLATRLYLFGGEPLMHPQFHVDLFKIIYETNHPNILKNNLWESASKATTNGTLIDKYPELHEKYGVRYQISLDGPKEIHDTNRIDKNGKGSFEKISKNIELLSKTGQKMSFHGVVAKNTLPYLFEIIKFFFELYEKYYGLKEALALLSQNTFMFVIEEDYTDEDIDLAIDGYEKFFNWLKEKVSKEDYIKGLFLASIKKGAPCSAGHRMLVLEVDGSIYPCHRGFGYAGEDRSSVTFGDSFTDEPINIQVYNNYFRKFVTRESNSLLDVPIRWDNGAFLPQLNYCPATYKEVCDTMFYVPPAYCIFSMELGNYLISKVIEEGFSLEDVIEFSKTGAYKEKDNG